MNDSEELKHARARIAADGRTIADLRAMLEKASRRAVNENPNRVRWEAVIKSPLARAAMDAFRKMHRRAQRAESRLARMIDRAAKAEDALAFYAPEKFNMREHEAELRWSVTGKADAWRDGGPHYVPSDLVAIKTAPVAEWAEDHFETFYNAALGVPWVQPEPEIIDVHGRDYYAHTPGDACPCDGALEVHVLWRIELSEPMTLPGHHARADSWIWDRKPEHKGHEAIAWRPKDAPDKLPRYVAHSVRPNPSACGQCADKL